MEKNLKYLYKNPDKLAELRRNAARLGEPGAANDVADLILSQSSSRTRR
jgi:UDP-N-acetylglucosamine:LPS N-acetylglucosamine transferase